MPPNNANTQPFKFTILYGLLLVALYVILQPNIFGPATNSFARGMETHSLLTQMLRYANEFGSFTDPVVRMWNGEFDIHHNPHMNLKYPFYFTWLGDYGDLTQSNHRVFLMTHFHHVIGGIGAFIFARALGARTMSCLAAGLFFALCLSNTYMSPFYTRLASSSWTPWGLAAVWLAASGKNPRLAIVLGVPSIGLLAFASSAQPLLYFVIMSAFTGLVALSQGIKEFGRSKALLKRCIIPSVLLVTLSACVASPALLPVLLEQSEYIRWTTDGPVVGSYKVSYEATLLQPIPGLDGLTNILVPVTKSFNIGTSFIGPIFVFIILATIFTNRLKTLALIFLGLSVYFIINGMGQTTLLPKLTYQIPLVNNVRQLTSHFALVNFAAIGLIAICFDFMADDSDNRRWPIRIAAILTLALTALILLTRDGELDKISPVFKGALITMPLLVTALTFIRKKRSREIILLLIAVAMVLPAAGLRTFQVVDNDKIFTTADTHNNVLESWEYISTTNPNALVTTDFKRNGKKFDGKRISSTAIFYGLRSFNTLMSPRPHAEFKHFNKISKSPDQMIDRGVQYILSNQPNNPPKSNRLDLVQTIGDIMIYKAIDPLARLKSSCQVIPIAEDCVTKHRILESQEHNSAFSYKIETSSPENLAFFGFKNDNWRGFINGEELTLKWSVSDHITFKVPAGTHDISFNYKDQRQTILWWIFAIGLVMTGLCFWFYGRQFR